MVVKSHTLLDVVSFRLRVVPTIVACIATFQVVSLGECSAFPDNIPTPDDYIVRGLDLIEPAFAKYDGLMYAGLVPTTLYSNDEQRHKSTYNINDGRHDDNKETNMDDGSLMFWLYAPTKPLYTDTLVIWLNGGPGCSSFGGSMFENGPVTIGRYPAGYYGIDPLVPFQYNIYAWTNATAIMYVEQPHGTGFSIGSLPNNETDVSRDFYYFLQNLYTILDQSYYVDSVWRSKRLFIFGESYAGMYVPSIAHYIYHRNIEQTKHHPYINLAGIALGNGWMSAQVQGPAVIDYAWWHGMIDSSTVKAMKNEWENCRHGLGHQPHPFHKFTVPDECGIMNAVLQAAGMGVVDWGTPNAYDVTTWDPYLMLDYPSGAINQFYNNPKVQEALNVPSRRSWIECMPGAGRRRNRRQLTKLRLPGQLLLDDDQPISTVPYVADLLDNAGIRVLIYNGDRDMTTNAQGSEMLLDDMIWKGSSGWINDYERGVWLPNSGSKFGGYIKRYQNLDFLIVYNSGHLVPFNQDEIALELVSRFLGNTSFLDKPLPKFNIERTSHKQFTEQRKKTAHDENFHHSFGSTRNFLWSLLLVVVGFIVGCIFSRRNEKGRGLYQPIPSN